MKSYQPVLSWIEQQLSRGVLRIGQRLPSERALAEQFSLSRTSVREAMTVLEASGVVRAAVGSGPDAGTVIIARPGDALGSALRFHVASSYLPVADIVQTRLLFETWSCENSQLDTEGLKDTAALLEQMSQLPSEQADEFLALDVRFHLAIADSAGNLVVSAMMLSLRESIREYTSEIVSRLPDWERIARQLHREHVRVFELLQSGEKQAAAQAISEHIEGFYRLGRPQRP